ncbi:hypothetical protein ACJMK2_030376 [Sinanodonta woodiana]|uniref:Ig-like domain-containing protein n=1 Tax=Sinanodonta woodiana TaxID=1069815 RepID=A0ABD3XF06_SINWO
MGNCSIFFTLCAFGFVFVSSQVVLEEFRLVCSAFIREQGDQKFNGHVVTKPEQKQTVAEPVSGIVVESADAVVTSSDYIYMIVKYKTIEKHHVLWAYNIRGQMIPIQEGDHLGTVHVVENNNPGKTALKINKTALHDVELLYLKVLSEASEVTLVFRMSAIIGGGSQNVPEVEIIHTSPSDIISNKSQDLTLKVTVKTTDPTVTGLLNYISIDNSMNPPLLLDLQGNDARLNGTMVDVAGGKEWTANVDSSLVALGGMLSFRIMVIHQEGIISQMYIGKTFNIYPESREASKSPFPENSVALLSIYGASGSTLIVKPPVGALWCYAFGSPSPTTKISRINFDGSRTLMNGTNYSSGKYDSATAITFQNVKKDIEGMYVCEAAARKSRREEFIQIRTNI